MFKIVSRHGKVLGVVIVAEAPGHIIGGIRNGYRVGVASLDELLALLGLSK